MDLTQVRKQISAASTTNEIKEASNKGSSLNYVLSYSPMDGLTVGAGAGKTEGVFYTCR